METRKFIIDPASKYMAGVQTSASLGHDGRYYADYSSTLYNNGNGNLTVEEYLKLPGHENYLLIDGDELDKRIEAYEKSFISQVAKPIDKATYWEALEVLPPGRWTKSYDTEAFFVIERITGDLVNWYLRIDDSHYTLVDYSTAKIGDLIDKIPLTETN